MSNTKNITFARNNSIDLFRYICALMVVIIHSTFWKDMGVFGDFLGNVFPRLAVPFFFLVTGYFFIGNILKGKNVLVKNLKHILIVYSLWSILYYGMDFLYGVVLNHGSVLDFLKVIPLSFLITGSTMHFWYFPALMISLCLVALFNKLKIMRLLVPVSILLYLIGCICGAYYRLFQDVPVISGFVASEWFNAIRRIFFMGFPFVSAGYILQMVKEKPFKKYLPFVWIGSLVVFLAEIYLVRYTEIAVSVIITPGLYLLTLATVLMLINKPLPGLEKTAETARTVANVTYYSHPFIIQLFAIASSIVEIKIPNILVIASTVIATFLAGLLLHCILKKSKNKTIKAVVKLIVG